MVKMRSRLSFLIVSICFYGQMVQLKGQSNTNNSSDDAKRFDFISKNLDISAIPEVATLNGIWSKTDGQTIVDLFNFLWERANKLGANSFRIVDIPIKSKDSIYVTLSVYHLTKEELEINSQLFPYNLVYVFGDIDRINPKFRNIKINDEKIKLAPMEYVSYQNTIGEDAIVSIGGLTGAKVWIRGKEGRVPKHLSVNGFSIGPVFISTNQIGIGFSTGKIYPVDFNFGQFLVEVLKENSKINYFDIDLSSVKNVKIERKDESAKEYHPTGKLIFYRRGNKENEELFNFSINDSIRGSFAPNSYMEIDMEIADNPIVICYKNSCDDNLKIIMGAGDVRYLECSIPKKTGIPRIGEIEQGNGKFFSDQAKYLQDKREKKGKK